MDDQRVKAGACFGFEDTCDRALVSGVGAQAVDRFGGDRDEMAGHAYGFPELGDALTTDAIQDSVVLRIQDIPGYERRFRAAFPDNVDEAEDIDLSHVWVRKHFALVVLYCHHVGWHKKIAKATG